MREITRLHYNWRQCGEAGDQQGNNYEIIEVGVGGVVSIEYDLTDEGPDSCFVEYEDGSATRIYNINQVFYSG